jgi:hypothetical protein
VSEGISKILGELVTLTEGADAIAADRRAAQDQLKTLQGQLPEIKQEIFALLDRVSAVIAPLVPETPMHPLRTRADEIQVATNRINAEINSGASTEARREANHLPNYISMADTSAELAQSAVTAARAALEHTFFPRIEEFLPLAADRHEKAADSAASLAANLTFIAESLRE